MIGSAERDPAPGERVVRAAGGIPVRGHGPALQVALVHRPRYGDWSFPKGKLENGETEEAAALREVEEETGMRCRLGSHLGAVTYTDRNGRPKIVRYWMVTPEAGTFAPGPEVNELRWLSVDDALATLSYAHDRDLLRATITPREAAPLYVVRHAKAGQRDRWVGPDDRRPITRRGRRQAERLVERFQGLEIARIVSSPFVRCVQTVEPLARARGLEIEREVVLAEGVDLDVAVRFVREFDHRPTVLCGHGREIEAIVRQLHEDGVMFEDVGGLAKGSVWVLDRRGGEIESARYLPAPPG